MNPALLFIPWLVLQLPPLLAKPETEDQKAIRLYPELAKQGSSLNRAFVQEVKKRRTTNPNFFLNQNWPTMLAKELADAETNALLANERAEKNALLTKQREAEQVKAMLKTIREVESDIHGFVGKQFMLTGSLDVSSFYHSNYHGADATHFAFQLSEGGKRALLYMPRASGQKIRDKLVKHGGPLRATCVVTILRDRFEESNPSVHAELIDVRPPVEK